jgi:hypothetical protein
MAKLDLHNGVAAAHSVSKFRNLLRENGTCRFASEQTGLGYETEEADRLLQRG